MPVLIHELLAVELWREHVYQKLKTDAAKNNSMRLYFILYHEVGYCMRYTVYILRALRVLY